MAKVFFFWITYCIYNQNIYTFGINQEIVRDICNNRRRSKLLIVSKYRIRTCLLVYLSSLSLQMLPFPTNCLYCGSQPPLLINTNNWTASNLSTSLNQLYESTATGFYLAYKLHSCFQAIFLSFFFAVFTYIFTLKKLNNHFYINCVGCSCDIHL